MGRKSYDRQFKIAAVKLVMEENMSVSEVAKELAIHYNSLYRCKLATVGYRSEVWKTGKGQY